MNVVDLMGAQEDPDHLDSYPLATNSRGLECTTPKGRAGVCAYVGDAECVRVYNKIVNPRNLERTVKLIKESIVAPCGLDGDDVTLCCEPRPPKTKAAAKDKANKKTREELDAEELEEDCGLRGGDVIVKRSAQFEIEPTVHGGLESAIGAWPWAAALGRVRIGGDSPRCAAALSSATGTS